MTFSRISKTAVLVGTWGIFGWGCSDANPGDDGTYPEGDGDTGSLPATGGQSGDTGSGGASSSSEGDGGSSSPSTGGAGSDSAGTGGTAEPGTGGTLPDLELLDTAIELGRSKITDHSYSASGVPERDNNYAGAMGGHSATYLGFQYVVYYEENGKVTIVRRDLSVSPTKWEVSTLSGYTVTTNDRHNKMAIEISKGDGAMHLAFDHHTSNEFHYAHTTSGVADDPTGVGWNDKVFTYAENLGHDAWFSGTFPERTVTYPSFMEVDGDIMLYWRSGGTAQGRMNLANYNTNTSQWVTRRTFTSEKGTYREGNWSSEKRGPYHAGIIVDPEGNLHVAWLWREAGCTQTGIRYCNHGLYYATSPDLGVNWYATDGEQLIGDGQTITVDKIEPVWDIGIEQDPSNPSLYSRFVEETGDFEVYVDHKDKVGGTSRSTYRYTRAVEGTWSKQRTDRTPGGLGVTIPPGGPGGVPNQTWDYARLWTEGIVSVVYQDEPNTRGKATPLYVIDYRFAQ